jgi:hypothetical protein
MLILEDDPANDPDPPNLSWRGRLKLGPSRILRDDTGEKRHTCSVGDLAMLL